MRTRYGILSGLIILAFLAMAGTAAAEDTAANITNITDEKPIHPPAFNMTNSTWPGLYNGTGNRTVMPAGIPAYNGTIGADNALYGLKLAFENLDETFTFNETERVEKQVRHMENRLSEYQWELQMNRSESADHVLELYREKLNQTEQSLSPFRPNDTGLLHAQEMITKHQDVLGNLLAENPGNQGLARAYNNSLALENKFEQKTQTRFEQVTENDNVTIKAVRLAIREEVQEGNAGLNQTVRVQQEQQAQQGQQNSGQTNNGNGSGNSNQNQQDSQNSGQTNNGNGSGNSNQNQQDTQKSGQTNNANGKGNQKR